MNIFDRLFLWPQKKDEGDLKSYLNALKSGRFKNKVVYGISDKEKGFLSFDPVETPGALYCGGMGSGKSIAMRFTVGTHIATNSENTMYIIIDPEKGAADYALIFNGKQIDCSKNVISAVNDPAKIVPVIDMVFKEYEKRKEEFSKYDAPKISVYEKASGEKLARIMICIEEFHAIPNSDYMKFHQKSDTPGTLANKFKTLLRAGRSYGISFMIATQRATSDDVPSSIKPGLNMMMSFYTKNPGDAAAINVPHAQDITMNQKGRCAYEQGFIQYPYLDDDCLIKILKAMYKPLSYKLLAYQVEQYHTAVSGDGNSGMVKVKPISELVKFSNQYQFRDIAERILGEFKMKTYHQNEPAFIADLIAEKGNMRYAVRLINQRGQGNKKEMESLKIGAKKLNCNGVIVMGIENPLPPNATSISGSDKDLKWIILETEDLTQIGNILDNKENLEKEGNFKDLYLGIPLSDITDLMSDEERIKHLEEQETKKIMQDQKEKQIEVKEVAKKENSEKVDDVDDFFAELSKTVETSVAKKKIDPPQSVVAVKEPQIIKKEEPKSEIEEEFIVKPSFKELKNEMQSKPEPQPTLNTESLLKIRERLKQELAKEANQE